MDQPRTELQGPALDRWSAGAARRRGEPRHDTKSRARERSRRKAASRARRARSKATTGAEPGAAPPPTDRGWRSPTATPGA